ncbi:MAG: CvpA family protein [Acetobacteraceae bacterium]
MTWVDLVVLGILVVSAALAFMRGLVREVLGIGAWVGAVVIAIKGLPYVRPLARDWLSEPAWIDPVAFTAVFLVSLIILSLLARMIGQTVRGSALGGVDRSLGLLFGLARGAALVILAYILGGMAVAVEQWPDPVLEARLLTPTFEGAKWAVRQLPDDFRPHVHAPPAGRQATADALLRATPQGTPLGSAPGRASGPGSR